MPSVKAVIVDVDVADTATLLPVALTLRNAAVVVLVISF